MAIQQNLDNKIIINSENGLSSGLVLSSNRNIEKKISICKKWGLNEEMILISRLSLSEVLL